MKKFIHLSVILFIPILAQSTVIHVNLTASGTNTGISWQNAYTNLHDALAVAQAGDTVWVAQGSYFPTSGTDRNARFGLPSGVVLLGGFDGTESQVDERDWLANPTILDGDIGVLGDSTDNSYTILYLHYPDISTLVDGFVFLHGRANGTAGPTRDASKCGGAIYIDGEDGEAHPRIHHCHFEGNYATSYGGAIYVNGVNGSVAPQFFQCTFTGNHARLDGGAIRRDGSSWTEVENDFWECTFTGNYAERWGGAIYYIDDERLDTVQFTGCSFFQNMAGDLGGGICIFNGRAAMPSGQIFSNCLFEENSAGIGGGVYIRPNFFFDPVQFMLIERCDFIGNTSIGTSQTSAFHWEGFSFDPLTSVAKFQKCNFNDNTGGGTFFLEIEFKEFIIEDSKFKNNISSNMILIPSVSEAYIGRCQFIDNTISGFMFDFGNVPIADYNNCIFSKNKTGINKFLRQNASTANRHYTNCIFDNLNYFPPNSNAAPGIFHIHNSIILEDATNSNLQIIGGDSIILENTLVTAPDCASLPPHVDCGPGNLFGLDPLLADTANGDYHLLPCSPARNVGNNDIVFQLGIATDLDGNPRILENTVDMGAYETPEYAVTLSSVTGPDCGGQSTGSIVIDVQSGCAPFTVDLGGASTVSATTPIVLQNLPAGTYDLTIIDAQGRQSGLQVVINQPETLVANALVTDVSCENGTTGAATSQASGGTPGYVYLWSGGSEEETIENLLAGSYVLTIRDSFGCEATDTFTVQTIGGIGLTGEAVTVTCHGDSDGTATAIPLDGTAPYSWLWLGGQTDTTIVGLSGGTYLVTVTDSLGCSGSLELTVGEPDTLTLEIEGPGLVCFESMDATAVAVPGGGTLPYTFEWGSGETDSLLTGIGQGTYLVTVTDANGCTATGGVDILQTAPVEILFDTLDATGAAIADGAVVISEVMGGEPPYTFLWNTNDTTQSLENVPPGTYSLTVTDALGCSFVFTFMVDFEVAVQHILGDGLTVEIFPNPVAKDGEVVVRFESPGTMTLLLRLSDANGRIVWQEKTHVEKGGTLKKWKAPDIPGTYWLIIENDEGKRTGFKWVVQ